MKKAATHESIRDIYEKNLIDLVHQAQNVHRENFKSNQVQASQLLSIKTGNCPENCSYCPQSAHYKVDIEKQALMGVDTIKKHAQQAKKSGATRFCMGAAWRQVKDGPGFEEVLDAVSSVKEMGLEVCCTLGMLTYDQAVKLKEAGLYAYNHNIDTCLLYTSPSPRDRQKSRMPSSA